MLKIGLTGGIGCGKTTAVDAFRALGVSIIDADKIAKEIVNPGQQALKEIEQSFGKEIILENGELNRTLLKEKIFSDPKALVQLEGILHPRIRAEIEIQISDHQNKPYIIVDVPLLVEKNYTKMFDRIIVVDCMPEQQLKRVRMRDEMSDTAIKKITQAQASRKERLHFATDILDNTGDVDSLLSQINVLHNELVSLS